MYIFNLLTADPSLGRIDRSLLSDQALMELLFEGMRADKKAFFQDENGDFIAISEWDCVKSIDEYVSEIRIARSLFTEKQFPFEFVPQRVRVFLSRSCRLHGTLDPSLLPVNLTLFSVEGNKLHGSVQLKSFPDKLRLIDISKNAFSGSLDLSTLPESIIRFNASANAFSGEISLNELPSAMQKLHLNANALSGSISIQKLPSQFTHLYLNSNQFEGNFRLFHIPSSLEEVCIWDNKWDNDGTLIFPGHFSEKRHGFQIYCACTAVLDEHGNKHPWEKVMVEMGRNVAYL